MGSKFDGIFGGVKDRAAAELAPSPAPKSEARRKAPAPPPALPAAEPASVAVDRPKLGRPRGKKSDPNCVQVTIYIRKETHRAIKEILFREGEEKDFSEVAEESLRHWLRSRS